VVELAHARFAAATRPHGHVADKGVFRHRRKRCVNVMVNKFGLDVLLPQRFHGLAIHERSPSGRPCSAHNEGCYWSALRRSNPAGVIPSRLQLARDLFEDDPSTLPLLSPPRVMLPRQPMDGFPAPLLLQLRPFVLAGGEERKLLLQFSIALEPAG